MRAYAVPQAIRGLNITPWHACFSAQVLASGLHSYLLSLKVDQDLRGYLEDLGLILNILAIMVSSI